MRLERVRVAATSALVGLTLGVAVQTGGALLLYADSTGALAAVGLLHALSLLSLAAGLWAGAADGGPTVRSRRWTVAVAAFLAAAVFGQLWLANAELMESGAVRALAVVIVLAAPVYTVGALLAAMHAARRAAAGGEPASPFVVVVLLAASAGVALAALVLIPRLDPGPVFLGGATLLMVVGLWRGAKREPKRQKEGRAMQDRVAIITGVGAHGQVGYAVAETFLDAGARVVVTDIAPEVEELAETLGERGAVVGVPADLTTREGADRVAGTARELFGGLDVLVNVAGGLTVIAPVSETDDEEWERELDRNARTTFVMSRAALPLLRDGGGAIVNFAAPAGLRAMARLSAYSAAKAAVIALTRSLALEEKEHGIRVNAIAPGMIDTEQNRRSVDDPEAVHWVTRREIARVALFLASDEASGVSGDVVHVLGAGLR